MEIDTAVVFGPPPAIKLRRAKIGELSSKWNAQQGELLNFIRGEAT
jgi:hypothetical protein